MSKRKSRRTAALPRTSASFSTPDENSEEVHGDVMKHSIFPDDSLECHNLGVSWWKNLSVHSTAVQCHRTTQGILDDTAAITSPFPNWWQHIDYGSKPILASSQEHNLSVNLTKSSGPTSPKVYIIKRRVKQNRFESFRTDKTEELTSNTMSSEILPMERPNLQISVTESVLQGLCTLKTTTGSISDEAHCNTTCGMVTDQTIKQDGHSTRTAVKKKESYHKKMSKISLCTLKKYLMSSVNNESSEDKKDSISSSKRGKKHKIQHPLLIAVQNDCISFPSSPCTLDNSSHVLKPRKDRFHEVFEEQGNEKSCSIVTPVNKVVRKQNIVNPEHLDSFSSVSGTDRVENEAREIPFSVVTKELNKSSKWQNFLPEDVSICEKSGKVVSEMKHRKDQISPLYDVNIKETFVSNMTSIPKSKLKYQRNVLLDYSQFSQLSGECNVHSGDRRKSLHLSKSDKKCRHKCLLPPHVDDDNDDNVSFSSATNTFHDGPQVQVLHQNRFQEILAEQNNDKTSTTPKNKSKRNIEIPDNSKSLIAANEERNTFSVLTTQTSRKERPRFLQEDISEHYTSGQEKSNIQSERGFISPSFHISNEHSKDMTMNNTTFMSGTELKYQQNVSLDNFRQERSTDRNISPDEEVVNIPFSETKKQKHGPLQSLHGIDGHFTEYIDDNNNASFSSVTCSFGNEPLVRGSLESRFKTILVEQENDRSSTSNDLTSKRKSKTRKQSKRDLSVLEKVISENDGNTDTPVITEALSRCSFTKHLLKDILVSSKSDKIVSNEKGKVLKSSQKHLTIQLEEVCDKTEIETSGPQGNTVTPQKCLPKENVKRASNKKIRVLAEQKEMKITSGLVIQSKSRDGDMSSTSKNNSKPELSGVNVSSVKEINKARDFCRNSNTKGFEEQNLAISREMKLPLERRIQLPRQRKFVVKVTSDSLELQKLTKEYKFLCGGFSVNESSSDYAGNVEEEMLNNHENQKRSEGKEARRKAMREQYLNRFLVRFKLLHPKTSSRPLVAAIDERGTKAKVKKTGNSDLMFEGKVNKPSRRIKGPYWVNARLYEDVTKAVIAKTGDSDVCSSKAKAEEIITKLIFLVKQVTQYRRKGLNPFVDDVVKHLYHSGLIKTAMNYICFCMKYLPELYIQKALRDTWKNDSGILGSVLDEDLNL